MNARGPVGGPLHCVTVYSHFKNVAAKDTDIVDIFPELSLLAPRRVLGLPAEVTDVLYGTICSSSSDYLTQQRTPLWTLTFHTTTVSSQPPSHIVVVVARK